MSKHRLLFLDFETYYDDEYSLRKLSPAEYILDPRYETIMCAVKEDMGKPYIVDGPDFPAFIAKFDPATTETVTFNSLFDNAILAWRYGFVPGMMLDSMGMARALRGHVLSSFSLENVAHHLGVGEKGHGLLKVKGMHRAEIKTAGLWDEFSAYAIQDVELNAAIFYKLIEEFPSPERRLMDLVLRCTIEPSFHVNVDMLKEHLIDVRAAKQDLLADCGVSRRDLMSTQKFQAALENLGVEVEMKTTPAGNSIPAFAKSDGFMEDLLADEDERVQALAAARLGFKSTIEETRAAKFLAIAALPWPGGHSLMPMPLRYGGAHTHRLSGDWGMNVQNMPTARGSKGKSRLRNSLIPPPDHVVVVADLGQIEARLSAWICGASVLLTQFRDKLDPYAKLGESIFGYPVDRKVQILEGFIGKTGVLGLGYGAGWKKFYNMVIIMARAAGLALGPMWTVELAQKSVETYRRVNRPMQDGWNHLGRILKTAWLGKSGPVKFGPAIIGPGRIAMPNGLALNYADPHNDWEEDELTYWYGKRRHKIYGAKSLENIIQCLARIIVMNAALRLYARGYRFVLQAHDELVFIVHKNDLDSAKKIIHIEMTKPPSWGRDIPLTADVSSGPSYGEAK